MALGNLIDALLAILSQPFPSPRPKSESERVQSVVAIIFWLILIIAVLLGLASVGD